MMEPAWIFHAHSEGKMPGRDRHQSVETEIFSRFAKVCSLPIQLDSIEKRTPPAPDIQCTVAGKGPVAFELVELIHCDFAALTSDATRYPCLFERAYQRLPVMQREELENRCGNALVHIVFHQNVLSTARKESIPHILSWLQGLEPTFAGDAYPEAASSLDKVLRKITIRRGHFTGPCFNVEAGGIFANPSLDHVWKKFAKPYESDCPMELLVYHERQLVQLDAAWVSQLHALLVQQLKGSRFRRVWVFDVQRNEIAFVEPA